MKAYLAGPDVFLPDAADVAARKKALCERYGIVGLAPMDFKLSSGTPAAGTAKAIFENNVGLMDEADLMIANLTPFRGLSADPGTAFELGYMFAKAKPVFGYANVDETYRRRVERSLGTLTRSVADGRWYAVDGASVEDFNLADNLMLVQALLAGGAPLVLRAVPPESQARDLAAFEECLRLAVQALTTAGARSAQGRAASS